MELFPLWAASPGLRALDTAKVTTLASVCLYQREFTQRYSILPCALEPANPDRVAQRPAQNSAQIANFPKYPKCREIQNAQTSPVQEFRQNSRIPPKHFGRIPAVGVYREGARSAAPD